MVYFNENRVNRIARNIVAYPGQRGALSKAFLHKYDGSKYCLVVQGRSDKFYRAYFFEDGKIRRSISIHMPSENVDQGLVRKHMYLSDLIKSGKHKKSILLDMIEERKEECRRFDKYSDEELGEKYDDYFGGIGNQSGRENFILSRRPDSEFFIAALLSDSQFLSEWHDRLMEYYFANNFSFDGLFENDERIVGCDSRMPASKNAVSEIMIAITNATFFQSNDSSINKNNVVDVLFGSNDYGYHSVGRFKTNLPEKDVSGKPCEWTKAILSASGILEANGYGKLLYGKIIESDDTVGKDLAFSYSSSEDAIKCYLHRYLSSDIMEKDFIHELGHRLKHKFLNVNQLEELERAYNAKKNRFTGLKPGDVVQFENGEEMVVDKSGEKLVNKYTGETKLDKYRLFLQHKRISRINGKDFLYEADGIPSNYSLVDFDEFVAECFTAWNYGRFNGDVKKTFDGIFGK